MDERTHKEGYLDFDEYIRQGEPSQKEKAGYWQTAIGLQAVDGLKTSDYLKATARKHIEGEIDIESLMMKKGRKQTRHLPILLKSSHRILLISALTASFHFIDASLRAFSNMPGSCETTTSPRKNGCWKVIPSIT